MTKHGFRWILTAVVLTGHLGCASGGGADEEGIVIGAVFADDISIIQRSYLRAVRLAVDEINASGAFPRRLRLVNRSPSRGDYVDPDEAYRNAMILHDQDQAVALLSGPSEPAYAINKLTNTEPYSRLVHCSLATSPGLNTPDAETGDRSDCYYRTIGTDVHHLKLGMRLMASNHWLKFAPFVLDDDFGKGVWMLMMYYCSQLPGCQFQGVKQIPSGPFDIDASKKVLDEVIALTRAGSLDITVTGIQGAQSPGVVKYLTENGYQGCLMLNAGAKSPDLFDIASGVKSWMVGGNVLRGIDTDSYQGKNAEAFIGAYRAYDKRDPLSFASNSYDCTYALALSMLYAGEESPTRQGIWEGIQSFKASRQTGAEIEIGIGAAEFARAAELIRGGQRVRFEGASGPLGFDEIGDRPKQPLLTFGPNDTFTDWVTLERFDADLNPID